MKKTQAQLDTIAKLEKVKNIVSYDEYTDDNVTCIVEALAYDERPEIFGINPDGSIYLVKYYIKDIINYESFDDLFAKNT